MKYQFAYSVPDPNDEGHVERNEFLFVNCAGYYETDDFGRSTHRKHGRSDYYLAYNHGGNMKALIGGSMHTFGAGTVFLYKPFEEQLYGQADENTISNYWVHFTGNGASDLLSKASLWDRGLFTIGVQQELPGLFERMIAEIVEKMPNSRIVASSILQQILFLISRHVKMNERDNGISIREAGIGECLQFIHKHYRSKVEIPELAHMCGLSASRFAVVFKQHTGLSPQAYLIRFRLSKAKEMMAHTTLNIRQISALVGFDDQLHFSKLFRKHEQMSPTEYIENKRLPVL